MAGLKIEIQVRCCSEDRNSDEVLFRALDSPRRDSRRPAGEPSTAPIPGFFSESNFLLQYLFCNNGSPIAQSLQVGGVYSYDCSFGHVPNVELMKFIAMATFGSYLSTCPELEPGNLGLTVYHRAFLLYSFLRSGEALNPEYYCGERLAG